MNARHLGWRQKNRERIRAYAKKDDRARYYRIKTHYGIDKATYERMVSGQGGECAICPSKPPRLYIDHDHSTGAVRGLLCRTCNIGIGMLKNVGAIRMAAVYLEERQ